MKTPEQQLKARIMKRVYGVWAVRFVMPRLAGCIALIAYGLRLTADKFFVARIIQNFDHVATSNFWALPQFITGALNHAQPQVLILIAVAGIGGFAIAVNLFRNIRSILRSRQVASAIAMQR